jgi:hypothetical protein
MNCSKCGNTSPITCGCETGIPTPPPCAQGTPACPDPDPCAETFDSQCIIYTGEPIECNQTTIVDTNDNISDALNAIVDYFCDTPAPAVCTCLYEAKVTLNKTELIQASTQFPGRVAKLVPITVAQDEAIEVVSASFNYVVGSENEPFQFISGDGILNLQIEGLLNPQFTNGTSRVLETTRAGIYLMQNYEYTSAEPTPNMAFGDNLYVVVNGVADSMGTPNNTITFNVLYRKTKY